MTGAVLQVTPDAPLQLDVQRYRVHDSVSTNGMHTQARAIVAVGVGIDVRNASGVSIRCELRSGR